MEEIVLEARYGLKHVLTRIDNKVFKINIDPNGGQYFRMGNTEDGEKFIDLDGGPFMVEGTNIPGTNYTIKKIKFIDNHGYCIIIK